MSGAVAGPLHRTSVVTYLQMLQPRPSTRAWPGDQFRIERLAAPSLRFYRYLYRAVGADWHWLDRIAMDDERLAEILGNPAVEVHLLTESGEPRGYGEIDRSDVRSAKITYFGLMPEAIGRGLGRWFLEQITARAWRTGPDRVWLHTCDLDHPRALANYAAAGFEIYDERSEQVFVGDGCDGRRRS